LIGFDNRFVLLRSVKTVSVVIFCDVEMGMLVKNCATPVLLTTNPAGKEVVFSNDPSAEYTKLSRYLMKFGTNETLNYATSQSARMMVSRKWQIENNMLL
jgi:hypothetical protein